MSVGILNTEIFRRSMSDHFYSILPIDVETTVTSVGPAGMTINLADPVPAGLKYGTLEIISGDYAGIGVVLRPTAGGNTVHVYQAVTEISGLDLAPGTGVRISGGPLARSSGAMFLFRPVAKQIPADADVVVVLNYNGYLANREMQSRTSGFFVEHSMTCLISAKRLNVDDQSTYLQAIWTAGLAHDQFLAYAQEYKGPAGRTRTIEPPSVFSTEWNRGEDSSTESPTIVQAKVDFTFRTKGLV